RNTVRHSVNTLILAASATLIPSSSQLQAGKSYDLLAKRSPVSTQKKGTPRMVMRKLGYLGLTGLLLLSVGSVAEAKHHSKHSRSGGRTHTGMASMYGNKAEGYAGRRTASGERVSSGALTAAHRSLPFGTMVRVTNTRTNRSVVVRINDRG